MAAPLSLSAYFILVFSAEYTLCKCQTMVLNSSGVRWEVQVPKVSIFWNVCLGIDGFKGNIYIQRLQ